MEEMMSQSVSPRTQTKRMDALLVLPLARFRRALTDLSAAELAALAERIAVQRIRGRWARGRYGIARHRVANELGLLARREVAVHREQEARGTGAPARLRLIAPDANERARAVPAIEEQAA